MAEKELVLFESADKSISLSVPFENDTVWLNQTQMIELFQRDQSVISRHIKRKTAFAFVPTTFQSPSDCASKIFRPQTKKISSTDETIFHRSTSTIPAPPERRKSPPNRPPHAANC